MARPDDVLEFIRRFTAGHGYAPTTREIAAGVGLSTSSAANYWVDRLVIEGRLRKVPGLPRALVVVEPAGGAQGALGMDRLRELRERYVRPVSCGLDAHEHLYDDFDWLIREIEGLRSHAQEHSASSPKGLPRAPLCPRCGGEVLVAQGQVLGCDRVSCR